MFRVQFTTEQRTFMVLENSSTGSPQQVIERFKERFPDRKPRCTRSIRHMGPAKTEILKAWKTTIRSVNNISAVHEALRRDPRISARRNITGCFEDTTHQTHEIGSEVASIHNEHTT